MIGPGLRPGLALLVLIALLPSPLVAGERPASAPMVITHDLSVRIDPAAGAIDGRDRLSLPDHVSSLPLVMQAGLQPRVIDGAATLNASGRDDHLQLYELVLEQPGPVTIAWSGRIRHPLRPVREGMGRAREQTIGTIDPQGVFLSGWTGWYPRVPDSLERFSLTVEMPPGWLAVSQGRGPELSQFPLGSATPGAPLGVRIGWREDQPQDEIYLIAAPFHLFRQTTPMAEVQAWLRSADRDLARRYMDATASYLERYSDLIGPYPYAKFALVENFWESGYGMPSFTLLGPRVLRLPFILHTSYPHEILHNWWGNGVFVDYARGNWSEGLTTYLADYLNQELDGNGADYRRDQLKAYADHVRVGSDFPVVDFHARHGAPSQAIGYGKAMMIFHMLRIHLGDQAFIQGLRRFYRDNLFRAAAWDDIRQAFKASAPGEQQAFLDRYFDAWLNRPGALRLALGGVRAEQRTHGGWTVSGRVDQTQAEAPFPLSVPVVIHGERGRPQELLARFEGRSARFNLELPFKPLRIAVDPGFDSFRELLPPESPVSLSNLFGAQAGLIVLPTAAAPELLAGYRNLALAWQQGQRNWRVVRDADLDSLPSDRPVWLLGWENRWLPRLVAVGEASGQFSIGVEQQQVGLLDAAPIAAADLSVTLATSVDEQPVGWIASALPAALPALTRKLPHYGKYGYLLFSGSTAENQLKGQWPAGDSALMHWFGDARPSLTLPARPTLVEE
ncbi:MAG: M1 family peptidase [Chromatiaceae bacterium]|nr:MAG: M1 family peptidase [Chromatiaceae bacterium]